ncbi:hypothetical protein DKT68_07670 [Micromonospora acroterricola]|uniref:Uncharacterized protein n=1 Tax=Micromonospora acroterricola TaxID=2202421 RepID=A0A317D7N2_9ACTN|nr:hypothetical protein [Micromonospora acroterricola]PWR10749.1 hypothetical protein DKT68_07670 [Micromonospora acroterricola]
MWIYAGSVASQFHRDLTDLLDDLRALGAGGARGTLERASEWADVDYTFGGTISVTPTLPAAGEDRRQVVVRPRVWFATHPLVPGRAEQRRLDPAFHGTDDVTWLLSQRVGGRDLAVGAEGPEFLVDLAGSREAQDAAAPTAEDIAAWQRQRCQCAPTADDDRRCEGPLDLIHVRDGDTVLHGCYGHAVDVLRRDTSAEVEPGTTPGYTPAALAAAAQGVADLAGPRRRDTR